MIRGAVGIAMNVGFGWITLGPSDFSAGMVLWAVAMHIVSDLMGSLGFLLAGTLTYIGWGRADSGVSLLIGCLIIYGSWGLIREGVDILMESVPAGVNLDELQRDLL